MNMVSFVFDIVWWHFSHAILRFNVHSHLQQHPLTSPPHPHTIRYTWTLHKLLSAPLRCPKGPPTPPQTSPQPHQPPHDHNSDGAIVVLWTLSCQTFLHGVIPSTLHQTHINLWVENCENGHEPEEERGVGKKHKILKVKPHSFKFVRHLLDTGALSHSHYKHNS